MVLPLAKIAQSFSVQPEATALYPFLVHPTQASEAAFLGSVYSNIFNRPIDAAGLGYSCTEHVATDRVTHVVLTKQPHDKENS